MKFTLIYDGPLPAGQKRRALYAAKIRNQLHSQIRDLWDSHVLMRQLRHEARAYKGGGRIGGVVPPYKPEILPDYDQEPPPIHDHEIDLCLPIEIDGAGFIPIIRKSLYLACALDILFLRHEEPGRLFEQGGDIDNRLKCFFDGLTIPNRGQNKAADETPIANPLCCLLEDDKYISDFSVRSGRLLGRTEKNADDVHIQVDVMIKVLRVFYANQGLSGA